VTGADAAALAIAGAVRARRVTARDVTTAALARIAERDPALGCFTHVRADAALAEAARVDERVAAGEDAGPLAGVPFAVKNLFDVAGLTTLAGSKIFAERPPATRDAAAVAALRRAGAVLVGALNMDEFAFGFTSENAHHGPTHNPHDPSRVPGGSSGGSAAAVAAGLVPLTLGSDTNGSIRVPAAFCGIFGLKPTYGRVSRAGVALFAGSLDHVGPFARSVGDLAAAFDAIQGPDASDPVCSETPVVPCAPHVGRDIEGLRLAIVGGHFARNATEEALAVVTPVARALRVTRQIEIPEAHRARAAAMVITAAEGANLHLADLKSRAKDFDPTTRDRFLAGALVPASLYAQAQRFRSWYRARVAELFEEVDVLLAPTTPWVAPLIGAPRLARVDGSDVVARAHSGVFTQPLSFIGLPVMSVPVAVARSLPLGVQLIAAPFREAVLFRVAARLEAAGIVAAPVVA
jgi:AtzE family amidohydrolase